MGGGGGQGAEELSWYCLGPAAKSSEKHTCSLPSQQSGCYETQFVVASLSSLSFTHTHTHTHTHTRIYTYTQTHSICGGEPLFSLSLSYTHTHLYHLTCTQHTPVLHPLYRQYMYLYHLSCSHHDKTVMTQTNTVCWLLNADPEKIPVQADALTTGPTKRSKLTHLCIYPNCIFSMKTDDEEKKRTKKTQNRK